MVSFDDVSFSYLSDPADSPQSQLCPDDEPEPDNHNGDKRERTLTPAVIIAIIVALAVVIIVITVLVVVASTSRSRRRRRRESMAVSNETYSNVGYRTFASEASALLSRQRGSIPDYEPMDGEDSPTKPLLLPSADSEAYNRLRVTGGASAMEQNVARAHYDHVNGDTAYRDLHQQHRARDAQRQHVANDYSHI